MTPLEFWELTVDEVELSIQGKVDDWRYQRRAALVTGQFKKGTTETDLYGLPFDDELNGQSSEYDIEEFYNNAYKGGLN